VRHIPDNNPFPPIKAADIKRARAKYSLWGRVVVRFKRWLMDQYCRDEVVKFAREMVAEQVELNRRQMRENVELRLTLYDAREQLRHAEHKVKELTDAK
jgi:hypothetical protein